MPVLWAWSPHYVWTAYPEQLVSITTRPCFGHLYNHSAGSHGFHTKKYFHPSELAPTHPGLRLLSLSQNMFPCFDGMSLLSIKAAMCPVVLAACITNIMGLKFSKTSFRCVRKPRKLMSEWHMPLIACNAPQVMSAMGHLVCFGPRHPRGANLTGVVAHGEQKRQTPETVSEEQITGPHILNKVESPTAAAPSQGPVSCVLT